jgi:YgiT-type zinc finger domain-containing protein
VRRMGTEMKTYRCSNCGEPARKVRENYLFKESGLPNVVLENIEVLRCEHCGNVDPIINRVNELMRVLALAVIEKPWGLTGEEIRFLRKFVDLSKPMAARVTGRGKRK